jgi:hypothetical protein
VSWKLLRLNCRDYRADVVGNAKVDVLAFVFAAGEGLHDVAMQIRMLAPVTQIESL